MRPKVKENRETQVNNREIFEQKIVFNILRAGVLLKLLKKVHEIVEPNMVEVNGLKHPHIAYQ